ncbi:MAG: ParB/RepB/Spo0J family partition protein [Planctomycetes bacterium]|nr:ParB/RepB/Spo0J family partition protein [Planctomycetota bacterium]
MNSKTPKKKEFQLIKVNQCVEPKELARMEIDKDEIENLARSIQETGSLQPIEVNKSGDEYEIVFGHRRWLAHKVLNKENIWARVIDLTKDEMLLRRATENISRENLTAVEEGANYKMLRDEFGMSIEKISKRVGRQSGRVKRMLDIMKMPVSFQKAIHRGLIKPTTAEAIWRCEDPTHREYLLDLAVEHGITTAVATQWVQDYRKTQRNKGEIKNDGGGDFIPMENKPNYMTCDVCQGPEIMGKVKQLILCENCHKGITSAK